MSLSKNLVLAVAAVFIYHSNYAQDGRVLKFGAYRYATAENIDNEPKLPFKWADCNFQIIFNSLDSALDIYAPQKQHYDITHVLPVRQLEDRTMYTFLIRDDQGQNCHAFFWYFPDSKKEDQMLIYHQDIIESFAIRLEN